MSQEVVEIVGIGRDGVWVEAMQQSACSSCNARSGCGQQSLSKLGRKMRLWVATDKPFRVGQQATLTLPQGSLAISALVLYGLPLLGMLLLSLLGHFLWLEPGAMLAGLAGLLLGFMAARLISERKKDDWQPRFHDSCEQLQRLEIR
ncbi:SoxR reducing system RseC family protein [Bacterioplanoides pacificum]|uniref:SoxR reducing system RseC family protein n=1 Tax=Bacterioplanoides pacificum TaxID=1171596 RepID=A0ABV7VU08_9GAMM